MFDVANGQCVNIPAGAGQDVSYPAMEGNEFNDLRGVQSVGGGSAIKGNTFNTTEYGVAQWESAIGGSITDDTFSGPGIGIVLAPGHNPHGALGSGIATTVIEDNTFVPPEFFNGAAASALFGINTIDGVDFLTGTLALAGNGAVFAPNTGTLGAGRDLVDFSGPRSDFTIEWDRTTSTVTRISTGDTTVVTNVGQLVFETISVFLVSATSDEFATIQSAITAAANGDEILVAASTYAEAITVNKGVTILGANAGVSRTGTRGAEAILDGTMVITAVQAAALNGMMCLHNDPLPRAKVDTLFTTTTGHTITNNRFKSTFPKDNPSVRDQAIYTTVQTTGTLIITDNFTGGCGSFAATDKYSTGA